MAALASGRAAGGRLLALESSDRMPLVCGLLMAALLYMPCLAAGQLDDSYSGAGQAPATQTSAAAAGAGTEPLWQRYEAMFPVPRMVPVVTRMMGHEVLYQVPDSPRATLFIAPGCSHAAHDWWPASPACPDCLGLPEELAHTQQALGRRYAGE
ncbi:hypothetical protein CHLNCDRAFT_134387 [Chlorella variabilis]|uniref:Uncharacterized protein n=1 Tax=Chlorella variabilis TaxID=554065 RepID=E1ZFW5_CHLVA|nr:hypothetical protein CHLNCDRAFT_134387 [Chlorella variabilis]EFN55358.1 hypothetical protein CHLNCDRAFT_134387 [Chlorella variabilis]|eukprot:XP_005847460.1 hypothetical protein CHLNCDRAFT_134387 [Chlorella variabilis]